MKKFLTVLFALIISVACVLGMTACGGSTLVKVAAQNDTTGYLYAQALKNVEVKGYSNPQLAAQDVVNGNADYVIVDKATGMTIVNSIAGLKMIDIALTSEQYAIGVDKTQADLLANINNVLATKQAEIQAIIDKYMDGDTDNYVGVESAIKNAAKAETQLVVATNAEFAPFEFKSGSKFYGIDMEVAKLIADTLGMELVIEDMAFEAVVTAVGTNQIDVTMAALTVTAARKQSITFTNSYYVESQIVLCRESNTALDEAGTVIDILDAFASGKK